MHDRGSLMTTAVNQLHHLLKSYVMELLYRKDYATETRPGLFIFGYLILEEFSPTKPSESKISMIVE